MTVRKTLKAKQTEVELPCQPCEVSYPEAHAIKAFAKGEANKDQQFLVIEWLKRATEHGKSEFRATDRESNFAAGKRFIYVQFLDLVRMEFPQSK